MSVADNIKHFQNIYMYIILKIFISNKNFEALKAKISDFKEDYNESVIVPPPQKKTFVIIVNENLSNFS